MKISVFSILAVFAGAALLIGNCDARAKSDDEPAQHKSQVTIEGLVRDIACPIQNLEASATHLNMKCLRECAKNGSPLVILTKEGDLYLPISDKMPDTDQRQTLMPFLGKYVRASGTSYERNGTHAIVISEIKELKDVRLNVEGQ
jgi:hypothetical protein